MPTLADIWKEEGMLKGREEGREEGMLLGEQEMLIDALDIRFGNISDSLIEKIKSVRNSDRLKILLRRAITVQNLEEFENNI